MGDRGVRPLVFKSQLAGTLISISRCFDRARYHEMVVDKDGRASCMMSCVKRFFPVDSNLVEVIPSALAIGLLGAGTLRQDTVGRLAAPAWS